jgi:Formamidopyrimidine-DNA glycosylase N-terminal domain
MQRLWALTQSRLRRYHRATMPELPEVELAARSLREWLIGRRVTRLEVFDRKLAEPAGGG